MNDLCMLMASHLRERAARCREMARRAVSAGIASEFCRIANDYDRDAEKLEAGAPFHGIALHA